MRVKSYKHGNGAKLLSLYMANVTLLVPVLWATGTMKRNERLKQVIIDVQIVKHFKETKSNKYFLNSLFYSLELFE